MADLLQDVVEKLVVVPLRRKSYPHFQQLGVFRLAGLQEGVLLGKLPFQGEATEEVAQRPEEPGGILEGEHLVEDEVGGDGIREKRIAVRVPEKEGPGRGGRFLQLIHMGGDELGIEKPCDDVIGIRGRGESLHAFHCQALLLADGRGKVRHVLRHLQDELGHRDSFIPFTYSLVNGVQLFKDGTNERGGSLSEASGKRGFALPHDAPG